MAKEPGKPSDGISASEPEDARADMWEATFFSPDGEEVSSQRTSNPEAPPNQDGPQDGPTTIPKPPITTTTPVISDNDPAFQQRLSNEAAASVEDHADELGEALHTKFMQLLNDKISETDGHLTPADVVEMGEEFKTQLEDIKTSFLAAVESYTLARERSRIDSVRTHLFTRLMVRKFEHRLRDERTLKEHPEFLSRRMLPGFGTMLSMMFGKPKLASYEKRIKAVAERLSHENGGQIDWEQFYREPEIKKLALRAEIEIAQNFQNINKRMDWMVAMINSNLIPADDQWIGSEWAFNDTAAAKLLTSLFVDLRAALKNPNARQRFSETLGADAVVTLDQVALRFC
jgi:hypothetical protein